MTRIEGFWAVVPAGGAGTRLWPVSRQGAPKFLHDFTGSGRSLLQATLDRLSPLCGGACVVVTGARHADRVAEQVLGSAAGAPAHASTAAPSTPWSPGVVPPLLVEPTPRDSMPAIGLAAAVIERVDPDAVIGSFAADHVIGDVEAFQQAVREAVAVARTGKVVTIGIEPTHPATGFGYIHVGEALAVEGAPHAAQVVEFVEKPARETAEAYLATGEFRWNAGMFVVGAGRLLDLLAQHRPGLAARLRAIAAEPQRLAELWEGCEKIAIDHAVAEPAAAAGDVAVIPAAFDWDDVGDFSNLSTLLPVDAASGLKVLQRQGEVLCHEATGVVSAGSGRTVAVLGLEDVVVIDTEDAVLVTTRERAQDVKRLVEQLQRDDLRHLT